MSLAVAFLFHSFIGPPVACVDRCENYVGVSVVMSVCLLLAAMDVESNYMPEEVIILRGRDVRRMGDRDQIGLMGFRNQTRAEQFFANRSLLPKTVVF